MKHITICLLGSLLTFLPVIAWAAQAPISAEELKKEATSIVSGTVVDVSATIQKAKVDKGFFNRDRIFTIKLKVSTVAKGSEVKLGEAITVLAWQAHRRLPWHVGPQGHDTIPAKGDTATCYLKGKEANAFTPILPNGISIHKKTN